MRILIWWVFVFLVPVGSAQAYKIDTHVWIAQQIVEEVSENKSIIVPVGVNDDGKQIAVRVSLRPEIVEAITKYPEYFLSGSIGPDAAPGIFSGQMTIHPGSPGKWGTSEWLKFASSRAKNADEIAYVLGYHTHIASDVFAHTYVNAYAGEHWELKGENAVERRHFVLEGYIASKTPQLSNNGQRISVRNAVTKNGRAALPYEWIRQNLMQDQEVVRQYRGTTDHLAEIHNLRSELSDLTKDDGFLRNLQDLIENAVIQAQVGLITNKEQREALRRLRQDVLDIQSDAADEAKRVHERLTELEKDLKGHERDIVRNQLTNMMGLVRAVEKGIGEKHRLEDEVEKAYDRFFREADKVRKRVCSKEAKLLGGIALICEVVKVTNTHKDVLKDVWNEKQRLERRATRELENSLGSLRSAVDEFYKAYNQLYDYREAMFNAGIDAYKLSIKDTNILIGYLKAWQEGIDRSLESYVAANMNTMLATLDEKDPWQELSNWIQCDLLVILGAPAPGVDAFCETKNSLNSILGTISRIRKHLRDVLPIAGEVDQEIEKLQTKIKDFAVEEIRTLVLEALGDEVKALVSLLESDSDSNALRAEFSVDRSGAGLLVIPTIVDRVNADMGLRNDRQRAYKPDEFAAIQNALTLSKLSLLGAAELNAIAEYAGLSTSTCYPDGSPLFPVPREVDMDYAGLILWDWVQSVDGNHQWLSPAPPHPRQNGQHKAAIDYGREWVSGSNHGMRFWIEPSLRQAFFKVSFGGPVAGGLYNSHVGEFPDDYPYVPTTDDPFPEYSNLACAP